MSLLLLDTHIWVWSMFDDPQLSLKSKRAMDNAEGLFVSPVSLYEISQKVRLGKWPELGPHVADLADRLLQDGGRFAPLNADICLTAGLIDWPHRDPFDRMIAATALTYGYELLSMDAVFDGLPGVRRIW